MASRGLISVAKSRPFRAGFVLGGVAYAVALLFEDDGEEYAVSFDPCSELGMQVIEAGLAAAEEANRLPEEKPD